METNGLTLIPDFILLRYITECGLSESNGQAHNLKICKVASVLPWTPSRGCFPAETTLFAFSKNGAWKGIGGISIEMLNVVSVP